MPTAEEILQALRICAAGGMCSECYRIKEDDCMWLLMADAAEIIEEYLEEQK